MKDHDQPIGANPPKRTFAIAACVISFVLVLIVGIVIGRFGHMFQELGIYVPNFTKLFISAHHQHLEPIAMLVVLGVLFLAMRRSDWRYRVVVPGLMLGLTLVMTLLFTIAMFLPLKILIETINRSPQAADQVQTAGSNLVGSR